MELSDQEKERIVAEEKVRAEARAQFGGDWHGCCGGGYHRRGGFLKGLLVGVLAFWAVGALCRHHACGGMGMYGHGCYGTQMTPPPATPAPTPKK